MSPEARSALMGRIRGRDTGPEKQLARMLRRTRRRFETHARDLPGRPDFVFRHARVAVFVDGDFWHGWRFGTWRLKLSEKWEAKISSELRKSGRRLRDEVRQRALRQGLRFPAVPRRARDLPLTLSPEPADAARLIPATAGITVTSCRRFLHVPAYGGVLTPYRWMLREYA